MRLAMKRLVLLVGVAVLALGGVAEAKRVASGVSAGPVPIASADTWLRHPTRPPTVGVKSSPGARAVLHVDVQCFKGSRSHRVTRDLAAQMPPFRRRVKLTIRRADECYVSVDASYEDFEQSGRVAVAVYY